MKKQIILLTLTLITILISVSACNAATYTVGSGPGEYSDIQGAVNAAGLDGDTVFITNGTYSGTGNNNIIISKNLTIQGQSQEGTIINGTGTGINRIFQINQGFKLILKDLTLTNGSADFGGAIHNQGNLTAENCTFTRNKAYYYSGAIYNYCYGPANVNCTLTSCTFDGNTASIAGGAISNFCYGPGNLNCVVTSCTFISNSGTFIGGAFFNYCLGGVTSLKANFNRFYGNTAQVGSAIYNYGCSVDAMYNWWGSNNPVSNFSSLLSGASAPNWLFMTINATPGTINNTQTSLITASFNNYSTDGTNYTPLPTPLAGHIPDGTPVIFSLTNGPFGNLTAPLSVNTVGGIASIVFTASQVGVQDVNATLDDQKVNTSVTINPAADVFVKVTPGKSKLTVGEQMVVRVKVGNNGPDSATNVIVTYKIPAGMEFVSLTQEAGYPAPVYDPATRTVTWNLGTLGIIDPWMDITLRAVTAGDLSSEADVTSDTYDPVPANNIGALAITVEAVKINAATEEVTVGMQQTGLPITGLILAILALFGGLATSKRK